MCAHYVSSIFIFLNFSFYIFTSQKSLQILREYIYISLGNSGWIDQIKSDIYRNIQNGSFKPPIFLKQIIIISESAKIYICLSTITYGIERAHKLGKQNINQLDYTQND